MLSIDGRGAPSCKFDNLTDSIYAMVSFQEKMEQQWTGQQG